MAGSTSFFSPALLGAFQIGLYAPIGPIVPKGILAAPPISQVPLSAAGASFLPVAASLTEEARRLKAQRRPAPVDEGSLIRRLWGRPGLEGYKRTISGLPRAIGLDPNDVRLLWRVWDAARYLGDVYGVTFRGEEGERLTKEVQVRHDREAVNVQIVHGSPGVMMTQEATVGRKGEGNFQSLGFQVKHEALNGLPGHDLAFYLNLAEFLFGREEMVLVDVDRSLVDRPVRYPIPVHPDRWEMLKRIDIRSRILFESARSVFVDQLPDASPSPVFQLAFSPQDKVAGPAALSASFIQATPGATFPEHFLALMRSGRSR